MKGAKNLKVMEDVDKFEEQYIRSGGKDPYVLTLLTRAHNEGKKTNDSHRRKAITTNFENMKQAIIRQYNDVELENLRLQYELLDIQHKLKSQVNPNGNNIELPTAKHNFLSNMKVDSTEAKPGVLQKIPLPTPRNSRPMPLQLTDTVQPSMSMANNLGFQPNMSLFPGLFSNIRNPFGNTYIVTGDEIYINGSGNDQDPVQSNLKVSPPANDRPFPISTVNRSAGDSRKPSASSGKIRANRSALSGSSSSPSSFSRGKSVDTKKSHRIKNTYIKAATPTVGFDGDWDVEENETDYNNLPFFDVNPAVPQGPYDFNSGILLFFDFVTKLPKEVRFCKLSVALITAGRMKPPISFTCLPTEQYAPGDHPEFHHFTTVCRFAYNMAVSGGRPKGLSLKSGIALVAEVMTSTDKPVDDTAPVLGWIRHGWVPIFATRKTFQDDAHLTTCAGRYRTKLRKNLPLTKDEDGLIDFTKEDEQTIVDHRTELYYRIVNSHQSSTERLAPVDIQNIEYYVEY